MIDPNQEARFLPFHAINEFMRPDFRLQVVRAALNALPALPEDIRLPVDRMTRQVVRVPGFRNSMKAPASLKARPMAEAFEKSPELVAAVLAAWAEAHPDLRQKVYDLLVSRGWEMLPPEADRRELPGFLTVWPKGEEFEVLNKAFEEKYPDAGETTDNVSLMIVWISTRLPYEVEGDDEEDVEEDAEPSDEEAS